MYARHFAHYNCTVYCLMIPHSMISYIFRFNKIAIQARAQMAADKEAVGLSRVHMYESKCILPLRDNCLFCS